MKKLAELKYTRNLTAIMIYAVTLLFTSTAHGQQKGWESLFDGKTLNGWSKIAGTASFSVENNCIVGTARAGEPSSFLKYKNNFGDFILEMDVMVKDTAFTAGIQFRSYHKSNSGKASVYGFRAEIDPTARQWTGGIYDEGRKGWQYPLSLNEQAKSAFEVGKFNHVKIEAIGAVVKTWVNGKPAAYVIDPLDKDGFIALQVRHLGNQRQTANKVYWKNIQIKTQGIKPTPFPKEVFIVNNLINKLSADEIAQGLKLLYNGKTAEQWRGLKIDSVPENFWDFKGGVLRILPPEDPSRHGAGGDIVSKLKYRYFDLSLEFNISKGGNSGVKYFVDNEKGSSLGLEFQILDDELNEDAKFGRDGNHKSGSLYDMIPARKEGGLEHPAGEWNKIRLVVFPDGRVEHYLNGVKVVSYIKNSQRYKELLALSKYATIPNFAQAEEAHILLQNHGNEVSFRNLKIREIK